MPRVSKSAAVNAAIVDEAVEPAEAVVVADDAAVVAVVPAADVAVVPADDVAVDADPPPLRLLQAASSAVPPRTRSRRRPSRPNVGTG